MFSHVADYLEEDHKMDASMLIPLAASLSEKLFKVFVESWSRSEETDKGKDKKQAKVQSWLNKNYDTLHSAVTDHSVHILLHTEYGDGLTIASARRIVHPDLSLSGGQRTQFDKEFHYRLEYLVLLGLLQRGIRKYHITRLGVTFLAKARERGHYSKVLKQK
jgi:hypothetical protein